uniref:Uncharacterized protein n=1 Tax=Arundo donax TaxID=35708 RepID=A0A0A9HUK0_ARUDO
MAGKVDCNGLPESNHRADDYCQATNR